MNILTINLHDKLIAARRRSLASEESALTKQQSMDREVAKLIAEATQEYKEGETLDAAAELGFIYKTAEANKVLEKRARFASFPQERLFQVADIKKMCLTYGLRFLPTSYYKGALDEGIPAALSQYRKLNPKKPKPEAAAPASINETTQSIFAAQMRQLQAVQNLAYPSEQYGPLSVRPSIFAQPEFYIAAPADSFALSPRPKDPLLFAYLGDGTYYLIHKWGDDLNVWSRIKQSNALPVLGAGLCGALAVNAIILATQGREFGVLSGGWWVAFIAVVLLAALRCAYLATDVDNTLVENSNWDKPFSN